MSAVIEARGAHEDVRRRGRRRDRRARAASISLSSAARWWRSSARAARERARCCTCSAALDRPTSGTRGARGTRPDGADDNEIAALRNESVGFVFQFHHLLREFTALENVAMPLRIAGRDPGAADARAHELLERMGLGGAASSIGRGELSGGEQQRAAVARALAANPGAVLADEPSGNLDHANGERLHDLLGEVVRDLGVAMVVVTHNRSLADRSHAVYQLEEGTLTRIGGEGRSRCCVRSARRTTSRSR